MSRLIWIYAVCKSLLLLPVAVKELKKQEAPRTPYKRKKIADCMCLLQPPGYPKWDKREPLPY